MWRRQHPPARFIHETGDCFLWAGSPLPRARAAAAGKGLIHREKTLVILLKALVHHVTSGTSFASLDLSFLICQIGTIILVLPILCNVEE